MRIELHHGEMLRLEFQGKPGCAEKRFDLALVLPCKIPSFASNVKIRRRNIIARDFLTSDGKFPTCSMP